jgi:MoxR-like ATPase
MNEEEEILGNPEIKQELDQLFDLVQAIRTELAKAVIGQEEVVEQMLASLLVGGHILLEGVPGIAKTLIARMLAQCLDLRFSRIQFTPDLMPTDVTGTSIFNLKTSEFTFHPGPVFANIVLIDEINRAPAKTQAALFEVMEERQVTIDGKTISLEKPFVVLATQNPFEQEGTYKLPEAQLDRFLFRIKIGYPGLEEEIQILNRFKSDFEQNSLRSLVPVANAGILANAKNLIERIHIQDELIRYIATLIDHTRNSGDLMLGGSPRASLAILKSSKAMAAMAGRNFVTPEDIQKVLVPVLNHRIILHPEKELEGIEPEEVIFDIVQRVEIPR